MASTFSIKSKAFTLGEAVMASFVFLIALGIIAQIIINLTKTAYQINELNAAIENTRLGLEKIWRELQYGSDFSLTESRINFSDRKCLYSEFSLNNQNLVLTRDGKQLEIFDSNLVKVNNWQINFDQPSGVNFYFESAPKVIVISYDLELKSKAGSKKILLEQAVAPLNSVFPKSPCQS